MESSDIYKRVQDHYGSIARADKPSNSSAIAQAFGYTEAELNDIPRDANLGLSCGNPLALATLREERCIKSKVTSASRLTWFQGECVIDLGSGAGFDVFLAAKKVGATGRAIGVDMNKDMLARARDNHAKSGGAENVSFVEGKITSIPIEDGVADCIISNCVINLVPEAEKPAVFAEMARLLKPGGRIAISDVLARKPLPAQLRESIAAYVGCVAGSTLRENYEHFLTESGFRDIVIVDTQSDLNIYRDTASQEKGEDVDPTCRCCSGVNSNPCCSVDASWDLQNIDANEWVGSYNIFALKAYMALYAPSSGWNMPSPSYKH